MQDLTWRPSGRRTPVLDRIDLHIEPGSKVLLAGPSGAGKSTLLRGIAGLLLTADVGELSGRVLVDGAPPQERPGQVGLLLQDPSAAVVADRVGRDVAFGLENTGVRREQMPELVRRALRAARFPYPEQRRTGSLSGGETQRLALAGALALGPRVLLLDEPTSMLDADNAARVRRSVLEVCAERGTTLVVVEHRLEPWVELVDRCVVLDSEGNVCADGAPREVLHSSAQSLARQGIWVPGVPPPEPQPVDPGLVEPTLSLPAHGPLVSAREVEASYRSALATGRRKQGRTAAVAGVGCELHPGRSLLLRGPSGAGKSTLLAVLAGLQRPDAGAVDIAADLAGRRGRALWRLTSRELAARLAWVPQLPEHGLVKNTVLDELLVTSRALGRDRGGAERRARELLDVVGLTDRAGSSAHHLSGGEQRRLVVAAALVHGPAGLLLDEPNVGQDRNTWAAVTGLCRAAAASGAALSVATHDELTIDLLGSGPDGEVLRLDHGQAVRGAA